MPGPLGEIDQDLDRAVLAGRADEEGGPFDTRGIVEVDARRCGVFRVGLDEAAGDLVKSSA
ncbi:MAG: hypothetical protein IPO51_12035 [Dehalococcoidia bacterium]|nr:hypothetical protein [Dehalococcoidia bacterium]